MLFHLYVKIILAEKKIVHGYKLPIKDVDVYGYKLVPSYRSSKDYWMHRCDNLWRMYTCALKVI